MNQVNLLIAYYSMTGTNYTMATWAKEKAEALGANVRLVKAAELAPQEAIDGNPIWKELTEKTADIPEASAEDIEWADAILFSIPTRFGVMASQMKQFIDTLGGFWSAGKTVNKIISGMTSAQNMHGGQEMTLQSLYTIAMHWGAIIVTPGFTDEAVFAAGGNPYGTSVAVDEEGHMALDVQPAVEYQVSRLLDVTRQFKN